MKRLTALAAAFAIALNALWPLLSHARPAAPGVLVPVCTIEGITHYLEVPGGKTPLEESASHHGEHCKLCVFEHERLAPHPVPAFVAQLEASFEKPPPRAIAIREPARHFPAAPRAPPAVS